MQFGLATVIEPIITRPHVLSITSRFHRCPGEGRRRQGRRHAAIDRTGDMVKEHLRRLPAQWPHSLDRLQLGIAPTIPHRCRKKSVIGFRDMARGHRLVIQTPSTGGKNPAASSSPVFGIEDVDPDHGFGGHRRALVLGGPRARVARRRRHTPADQRAHTVAHDSSDNIQIRWRIAGARDCLGQRSRRRRRQRRMSLLETI